jgi:hypothetical protein
MDELQKQIDQLKQEIEMMKQSSTFPYEIGNAIAERLSDKDETIATMTRTGTASASVTRTISLTGDVQVITVSAYPDGYRIFRVGGKDIYVPYFTRT